GAAPLPLAGSDGAFDPAEPPARPARGGLPPGAAAPPAHASAARHLGLRRRPEAMTFSVLHSYYELLFAERDRVSREATSPLWVGILALRGLGAPRITNNKETKSRGCYRLD